MLADKLKTLPKDTLIGFPDTAYHLPLAYALLGLEIKRLSDLEKVLAKVDVLFANENDGGIYLPYLDGLLNMGLGVLFCEELIASLLYLEKKHPHLGWQGFIPDNVLRSLGIQLVDGRITGVGVIVGTTKDAQVSSEIIRSFQSKNIVSILTGALNGITLKSQLEQAKIEMGLDNYIVPLGPEALYAIYAVNWAIRAPLTFGGVKPGEWQKALNYCRDRVPAFVMVLGDIDDIIVATGIGALALGFPIITDLDVPELGKIETTLFESLVKQLDHKKIVDKAVEIRGIKVKVKNIDIPVMYGAAFEGERVRRENLHVEFGGRATNAFEYLRSRNLNEIEDGFVSLIGNDIDNLPKGKKSMPLGILVEVAGRKMQKDFEPILERQIHRYVNYTFGLMHVGQRDMCWIRINKEAFTKGFRLKHIGKIIHAMLHEEYSTIVDKVAVKIYTNQADIDKLLVEARESYNERDERVLGMTDESVDTFYSCLLCQSFAPNHVCIVTPERLGLCGAYSWLDAKASFEIKPTGPNQPIKKGSIIDARLGQWKSINDFILEKSNKTISNVSMYSLMQDPQTSCGCFECIVAVVPEANGIMVASRDYSGMTPCGMTFTTLAGSVGGGVQSPGFLGVGRLYIVSKKFVSAEDGIKRLVWMPKELKESLGERLVKRCEEAVGKDFYHKIADETIAVNSEELLKFLEKVGHPALTMPSLL